MDEVNQRNTRTKVAAAGKNFSTRFVFRYNSNIKLAVYEFSVSRNHVEGAAAVALIGIAEGMDIHLYASGYTTPIYAEKLMEWWKVAVVEEAQKKISDRTLAVVVDALAGKLAHEIRNLILKREQK